MTLEQAQKMAKEILNRGIIVRLMDVAIEEYREACCFANRRISKGRDRNYVVIEKGIPKDKARIWAVASSILRTTNEVEVNDAIKRGRIKCN